MKLLLQITDKERIIQNKKNGMVRISLQTKRWYGWKTDHYLLSGQYPNVIEYKKHFDGIRSDSYKKYLEERESKKIGVKNQF